MFKIVLVRPEIPANTGNVIRLAANTGCDLHLIEPLGFAMTDPLLRRAGLDYHEYARVERHASWPAFVEHTGVRETQLAFFSTRGSCRLEDANTQPGDWLVFGAESSGLPAEVMATLPLARCVRLPMRAGQRSLNLSNAVAVAVFDAWRRAGYAGAAPGDAAS